MWPSPTPPPFHSFYCPQTHYFLKNVVIFLEMEHNTQQRNCSAAAVP
jgi:hypothetical protein